MQRARSRCNERRVTLYYAAMVLLSIGAFIHSKSPAPEMRPASEAASTFWVWLSRAALVTWIALIVWGFRELHWSQPVAAVMVSLVGNAVIAMRGPRKAHSADSGKPMVMSGHSA
mgnify:CR=1 FL=1